MLSFKVTVRKGDSLDNMAKSLGLPRDILLKANQGAKTPAVLWCMKIYEARARLLPHNEISTF